MVLEGSWAAADEVPSFQEHWNSYHALRTELKSNGVLVSEGGRLKFSQDYTFSSPSMASAMVTGASPNGRVDWKDSAGKTLREIQASDTTGSGLATFP